MWTEDREELMVEYRRCYFVMPMYSRLTFLTFRVGVLNLAFLLRYRPAAADLVTQLVESQLKVATCHALRCQFTRFAPPFVSLPLTGLPLGVAEK